MNIYWMLTCLLYSSVNCAPYGAHLQYHPQNSEASLAIVGSAGAVAKIIYSLGDYVKLTPFIKLHRMELPSLRTMPLLYYPMIIQRAIKRNPHILPQTYKRINGIIRLFRDWMRNGFNLRNILLRWSRMHGGYT